MCIEKLLISSSLSLETNGHDLGGIGDVGLSVNAARFRNKLHDVSGRMFLVLAKGFNHRPDIATPQTMFWKINQQRYQIVFFDFFHFRDASQPDYPSATRASQVSIQRVARVHNQRGQRRDPAVIDLAVVRDYHDAV